MERDRSYLASVGDIVLYHYEHGERIYRLLGIHLGAEKQEGVVHLEPLGYAPPHVGGERAEICIPVLIFEKIVRLGVLECVWRKPQNPENSP